MKLITDKKVFLSTLSTNTDTRRTADTEFHTLACSALVQLNTFNLSWMDEIVKSMNDTTQDFGKFNTWMKSYAGKVVSYNEEEKRYELKKGAPKNGVDVDAAYSVAYWRFEAPAKPQSVKEVDLSKVAGVVADAIAVYLGSNGGDSANLIDTVARLAGDKMLEALSAPKNTAKALRITEARAAVQEAA